MELSGCNIEKFLMFSRENEKPEKAFYISGNGTFLYFKKQKP